VSRPMQHGHNTFLARLQEWRASRDSATEGKAKKTERSLFPKVSLCLKFWAGTSARRKKNTLCARSMATAEGAPPPEENDEEAPCELCFNVVRLSIWRRGLASRCRFHPENAVFADTGEPIGVVTEGSMRTARYPCCGGEWSVGGMPMKGMKPAPSGCAERDHRLPFAMTPVKSSNKS
jgi:hypothetical protein